MTNGCGNISKPRSCDFDNAIAIGRGKGDKYIYRFGKNVVHSSQVWTRHNTTVSLDPGLKWL